MIVQCFGDDRVFVCPISQERHAANLRQLFDNRLHFDGCRLSEFATTTPVRRKINQHRMPRRARLGHRLGAPFFPLHAIHFHLNAAADCFPVFRMPPIQPPLQRHVISSSQNHATREQGQGTLRYVALHKLTKNPRRQCHHTHQSPQPHHAAFAKHWTGE